MNGKRPRVEDVHSDHSLPKPSKAACDLCRRGKMRCIGKDDPPCERCRSMGYSCTFTESRRARSSQVDTDARMHSMEKHIASLQATIEALMSREGGASGARPQPQDPVLGLPSMQQGPSRLAHLSPQGANAARPHVQEAYNANSDTTEGSDHDDPLQAGAQGAPFMHMLSEAAAARDPQASISPDSSRLRPADSPANLLAEWLDPVTVGLCTEAEGRYLFEIYFAHCHDFFPVWDPAQDTWESLRSRSAFAITVLIMVGKMAEDSDGEFPASDADSGPPSQLQENCRLRAEDMAGSTLFSSSANLEILQANMVLSCWSEHSWRSGAHCLALAMDLGIYQCLPKICSAYPWETAERPDHGKMVVGARVWLALLKMRLEMAFNLGRPLLGYSDELLSFGRLVLKAPLTTLGDCRLVSGCEMLALRVPLHFPLTPGPPFSEAEMDRRVREARRSIGDWESYWHGFYASRGLPSDHVLRELLASEIQHAVLHTSIKAMSGITSREDVAKQSGERQEWLLEAVRACQTQVDLCIRHSFRAKLRYSNLYTFVSIAFVGRCLIRFASLCPALFDLHQTGKDVAEIADILEKMPGFSFAKVLRRVLNHARQNSVLPPRTRPSSPVENAENLLWAEHLFGNTQQEPFAFDGTSEDPFSFLFNFPPIESASFPELNW